MSWFIKWKKKCSICKIHDFTDINNDLSIAQPTDSSKVSLNSYSATGNICPENVADKQNKEMAILVNNGKMVNPLHANGFRTGLIQ